MVNRRDPQTGDYTYSGVYAFGDQVREVLLRADAAWSNCAERITAAREVIRICDEIIADCKERIERVERLLAERARASSTIREREVAPEVGVNNAPLPETQTALPSTTSSATTLSGADG